MKYFSVLIVLLFSLNCVANEPYIPKNILDAINQLDSILKTDDKKEFKKTKKTELSKFHMRLGMSLRNGWGLWSGSRLSKYFQKNGIGHPDEMSGFIINSYWLHLHDKPLNIEKRFSKIKFYKKKNAKPKTIPCKDGKHLFSLFHPKITDPESTFIYVAKCGKNNNYMAYDYLDGWYKPKSLLLVRIRELNKEGNIITAPLVGIAKAMKAYDTKASMMLKDDNFSQNEGDRLYLNNKLNELEQIISLLLIKELKQ